MAGWCNWSAAPESASCQTSFDLFFHGKHAVGPNHGLIKYGPNVTVYDNKNASIGSVRRHRYFNYSCLITIVFETCWPQQHRARLPARQSRWVRDSAFGCATFRRVNKDFTHIAQVNSAFNPTGDEYRFCCHLCAKMFASVSDITLCDLGAVICY